MFTVFVVTATLLGSTQDGLLLRLNMPQGSTYRLASTTLTDQMDKSMKMSGKSTSTMVLKITKKTKDSTTIVTSFESMKINMNGQSMDSLTGELRNMRLEATYDNRGIVLRSKISGVTGFMETMAKGIQAANFGFLGITYPVGRVRVGSSWKQAYSLDSMMKAMIPGVKGDKANNMSGTYKVLKIVSAGGKTLMTLSATIGGKGTYTIPQGRTTLVMSSKGTMVINATTGMVVDCNMKGKNVISGITASTQTTTMTMRLVR